MSRGAPAYQQVQNHRAIADMGLAISESRDACAFGYLAADRCCIQKNFSTDNVSKCGCDGWLQAHVITASLQGVTAKRLPHDARRIYDQVFKLSERLHLGDRMS